MHDERLFLFIAGFVDDRDAALLSEGQIGRHHLVFAVFAGERSPPDPIADRTSKKRLAYAYW